MKCRALISQFKSAVRVISFDKKKNILNVSGLQSGMYASYLQFRRREKKNIILQVELIGLDKSGYQVNIFFFFLHENICCGYSLEAPRRGASNEYLNICFRGKIRKISTLLD